VDFGALHNGKMRVRDERALARISQMLTRQQIHTWRLQMRDRDMNRSNDNRGRDTRPPYQPGRTNGRYDTSYDRETGRSFEDRDARGDDRGYGESSYDDDRYGDRGRSDDRGSSYAVGDSDRSRDFSGGRYDRSRDYPGGNYDRGRSFAGDDRGNFDRDGNYSVGNRQRDYGERSGRWANSNVGGTGYSDRNRWSEQGWQEQNRGPHAGKGPKGYSRSDDRIREDLSDRFTAHPDLDASDIEMDVNQGEVNLRGTVDSRWSKRLAEDLCDDCHGVRQVNNQLRVADRQPNRQGPSNSTSNSAGKGDRSH
jgi:osmotically-inducible protein OsmY